MFGEAFIEAYENKEKYFETGFIGLDESISGVTKGSIITIGARPSMGKSSFAISICNHLLDTDKKVLFCELDSSEQTIERQFLQIKSRICDYQYNKKDWEKIKEAIDYYQKKPFTLFCKVNMSIEELEEKVKEEKPDILFIDCIQCIKMPKAPNLTEAINLAIKEVKRIAVENDLIVVLTSQVSRSSLYRCDHRPIISDLRNGSLLEDLSDVIMMIYREEYYDRENKDLKNKADIIIAKNKFGELSYVNLYFAKGFFANTFEELNLPTEEIIKAVFS